jgi:hypothetical protein
LASKTIPEARKKKRKHAENMSTPRFWSTPIAYCRWAAITHPAIFYSIVIGSMGPVFLVAVPPIRRRLGDVSPEPVPLTYPSTFSFASGEGWGER